MKKETLNNLLKVTRPMRSGATLEPRLPGSRLVTLNEHTKFSENSLYLKPAVARIDIRTHAKVRC